MIWLCIVLSVVAGFVVGWVTFVTCMIKLLDHEVRTERFSPQHSVEEFLRRNECHRN